MWLLVFPISSSSGGYPPPCQLGEYSTFKSYCPDASLPPHPPSCGLRTNLETDLITSSLLPALCPILTTLHWSPAGGMKTQILRVVFEALHNLAPVPSPGSHPLPALQSHRSWSSSWLPRALQLLGLCTCCCLV